MTSVFKVLLLNRFLGKGSGQGLSLWSARRPHGDPGSEC